MRKLTAALLFAVLFPYVVTMAWTGSVEGRGREAEDWEGRKVLLDRGGISAYMDLEEYLAGVLAAQIPVSYGEEALKAQAIIARTYICSRMGTDMEIPESALDLDYLEGKQLTELWGEAAAENYGKLKEAAAATAGLVIMREGELIEPLFHRASAGTTRKGGEGYPYLEPADCPEDLQAEGYLQGITFEKEELAERIGEIPGIGEVDAADLPEALEVIRTDGAGYVEEVRIGTETCTGEAVQYALGLASPCFSLEEMEGKVRAVTRGIGHGYGMSQYGADVRAGEGWKAEDILCYFYKDVTVEKAGEK